MKSKKLLNNEIYNHRKRYISSSRKRGYLKMKNFVVFIVSFLMIFLMASPGFCKNFKNYANQIIRFQIVKNNRVVLVFNNKNLSSEKGIEKKEISQKSFLTPEENLKITGQVLEKSDEKAIKRDEIAAKNLAEVDLSEQSKTLRPTSYICNLSLPEDLLEKSLKSKVIVTLVVR